MNIQTQFTFNYFIVFSIILLVVNFILFKFKKTNWREFVSWKLILWALIFTFLGLFYAEISHSSDWMVKTYGFPKYFYLTKIFFGEPVFAEFYIQEFNYLNFLQNFLLTYFFSSLIFKIFKK